MNLLATWQVRIQQQVLLLFIGLCLTSLFVIQIAMAAVVNKTVTITTQEWPPYQINHGNYHSGFAIEALDCVMKRLEQPYKIIFLPWGRAQHDVKTNVYDGFFAASQNNHRDTYAKLSNTFIEQKWQFFLAKDFITPLDAESIKTNVEFGSRLHSNTSYWLNKNGYKVIYETTNLDELIPLLQKKRIGAIMENSLLFQVAIDRAGIPISEFNVVNNIEKPLGVYFGDQFLKQNPQFLDAFNQHTQACRFTSN
ncbi:substrate-binding periplasmic protein [Shewanella aestuarii]|uniref:Amino acid ABC transporter substrate-binding protein n=1 Tax=Shewanella aestuarii TaxID=1028752 RepID=A0A6G9QNL1_9GAMM|nr:transporter substrate-binding domain-containing protein [Shewanella aestuarii]QIR15998.1 amino acid ABC transporter substrate-binding protein [Shewanella aestuarii]